MERQTFPLAPFDDEDGSFFKVYLLDTGLMFYKLGINPRLWLDLKEDSTVALSSDFRGALAENSVMQAFSGNGLQTYYWMPDDAAHVRHRFCCGRTASSISYFRPTVWRSCPSR